MPIGAGALKLNPGYLPRFGRSGGNLWAFAEVTILAKTDITPSWIWLFRQAAPNFSRNHRTAKILLNR
jgi:hypothetical protein